MSIGRTEITRNASVVEYKNGQEIQRLVVGG